MKRKALGAPLALNAVGDSAVESQPVVYEQVS
jgi:hypothetical protein